MKGEYVYTKYGKGIFIEDTWKNPELILTEEDKESKTKATIKATLYHNKLSGTYTHIKRNKIYRITATKQ